MASQLQGIGEIVAYLPYELGFVPTDSLAVVAMRERHVAVTARFDRPDGAGAFPLAGRIATSFRQVDPDDVLVLSYDGFGAADQLFVLELRSLLRAIGAELSHVAQVQRGGARWRSEQCSCGACPRSWVPVPPATGVAPVAERVARGVVPAASRAEVARRLDVRHPLVARAVAARVASGEPLELCTAQALPRVLVEAQTPVHQLPVDVLAGATAAVQHVMVRDQVLSWLMPDFLPGEVVGVDEPIDPHHLGLPPMWLRDVDSFDDPVTTVARRLEEWVASIPRSLSVPVLLLLAGIQWTAGNGVVASMAVDHALEVDPGCRLARLLEAALDAGLRPSPPQQRPA